MNASIEKMSKHIKMTCMIEYIAIGSLFGIGKLLLDIYYGRNIWEENPNVTLPMEGNPEFYISKEDSEYGEE